MPKTFNTSIENKTGSLWITFKDSIDMDNYKIIEDGISQKIKESDLQNVVIDLSKTAALFSAGLGVIMRMHHFVTGKNKQLFIVNASEKVKESLEVMNLNKILSIYSSVEEFKASLEKSARK